MGDNPLFGDPQFDALRNALYHTARGGFLSLINKTINFIVIVLSADVVGKAAGIGVLHIGGIWIELCVTAFATAQLVFDFGSLAQDHKFLQRRYYELLSEMELDDSSDKEFKKKWSSKLTTLCGDETLTMHALNAIAYNKALDALRADEDILNDYHRHVKWWHVLLRNIFAFNSTDFHPKRNQ